jgi:O-antigen/teichoic acid export membrane protein
LTDELVSVAGDAARGGFFLFSGSAIATVVMAIASVLIARFLGPELYGQYALALVVPQMLFLFTDLGINQGITKFAAALHSKGETNRISSLIKHGLIIRATIGIAIFAINYAFAEIIASAILQRPELAFYMQIASISILFQIIFTTVISAFVGLDKSEYQAIATNILAITKTIVSITLVLIGLSLTGALIGFTTSYIVAAAASIPLLLLLLRKNKESSEKYSFETNAKTLFHYGTPLYLSVLLTGFLPLFINILLAFFTTDASIGNYKAAINFATLLTVLTVPLTTVLLPAFSKLDSITSQKIKEFFKIVNKYAAIMIIPVTFLIITLSNEIVQTIYGTTYDLAPLFLSTYCSVYFLVGIGYLVLPTLYNGLGETKTTLKMSLITFATLILTSLPLTQQYGVHGTIVSFLIANSASTIYGLIVARRKLEVELDIKTLATIYLISALSCITPLLLITLTNLPNILNVALGGILYIVGYLTLLPLTNLLTPPEIQKITVATKNTLLLSQISHILMKYQMRIIELKQTLKKPIDIS